MADQANKSRIMNSMPSKGLPKIVGLVDIDDESEKASAPVVNGGVVQVMNMYVDGDSPYGWLALKEKHRPSSKRTLMYLRPIIVQEPIDVDEQAAAGIASVISPSRK